MDGRLGPSGSRATSGPLRAAGLTVDPALVEEGNFLPSVAMPRPIACSTGRGPTRSSAPTTLWRWAAYEALKERGERVGETIGVMGYDDQEIAQHLNPPLSTVLLPHREMGQWATRRIIGADTAGEGEAALRMECPTILRQSHFRR